MQILAMAFIPVFILLISLQIASSSGVSSEYSVVSYSDDIFASLLSSMNFTPIWASLYDYEAKYPLNLEANACSKSYSLPLNTSVRFQAVSSSNCTININTPLNSDTWFVIKIRRREGNPYYSTFFVEKVSKEDSHNAAEIISLPFNDCKVKLLGKSLILHIIMAYIDINVHNLGNITETTLKQDPCGVKYDGVEWYHYKSYPFRKYNKFIFGLWTRKRVNILANMFHLFCPKGCNCSLGHNQWLKKCQTDVHKVLLVCNPNIVSLSFSKRRLSEIDSEAFLCYVCLRKLILRKNHIQTLPKQTFKALEKLTFLDVGYNQLMFLPNGIFDHQLELEYLKLNNNYLSYYHLVYFIYSIN